ncbi:Endoribonuclease L-PSP/chorismate mutase-like [Moorella glycerini]|uniref:Enamine/imine deaminase n=1 Tax=Neomoorella stamsii TaxID=1266720 RepID=A0A9X7P4M8_9FIRM|nr:MULTISPECIES: Rid family detoxifying hydrolase [Moorella]PRR68858.1 Enamine/imine deaminase [Moorella stamsii]CEP67479.1 Endoribonuclease L-PSP/chorismate mutase-like [Moorella glycerini]
MSKIPVHPVNTPLPAGPYTHAIIAGDYIFVSGQTPEKPGTDELVEGGIKEQTRQVLEHIKTILATAGCTMDDVVKVNAYLADINDFSGYNEVYKEYFSRPYPARLTVQSANPSNALVEIDVIAYRPANKG